MVPERCLTLALGRDKSFRTWSNDPIFRAASSSMRQLGAPIVSPSVRVTIRSQGTKAPVKTLEARDRRSPLTTWRMSRIAKGSYCRARFSQKQALAQIAKSGGLRFRSELPAVLASGKAAGGVGGAGAGSPMLALSSPNEASLCATAST